MAETPADQSPARAQAEARTGSGIQSSLYWCYSCNKRVAVETLADLPDVVCYECKNGFVESITDTAAAAAAEDDEDYLDDNEDHLDDEHNFGNQFIQILRLITQAGREEGEPPALPSATSNDDYLQIELDEWDNDDDDEEEDDEEEVEEDGEDEEHSVIVHEEGEEEEEEENREGEEENNRSDGDEEEGIEVDEPREEEDEEEEMHRRRRDVLRLRLRDFATRAASRRNRILDWADVLMGLENHSIELTLQVPDSDTYVGNPGDYVDASEYEALLLNLAESDSGVRRGAPPASKAAVEGLESVEIVKEDSTNVCAICKELVNVGEIAKNLPCGHGYHGDCIVPWLGSRNSCPVCRFELPTDDPEYEEERKRRVVVAGLRAASTSSSPSPSTTATAAADSDSNALE